MNSYEAAVDFKLPESGDSKQWTLLIDTNLATIDRETRFSAGEVYLVTGRSFLLLIASSF
jgi:hypothetical protein